MFRGPLKTLPAASLCLLCYLSVELWCSAKNRKYFHVVAAHVYNTYYCNDTKSIILITSSVIAFLLFSCCSPCETNHHVHHDWVSTISLLMLCKRLLKKGLIFSHGSCISSSSTLTESKTKKQCFRKHTTVGLLCTNLNSDTQIRDLCIILTRTYLESTWDSQRS